jgi:raffinose/stachyose/melibiose transport system permease protein
LNGPRLLQPKRLLGRIFIYSLLFVGSVIVAVPFLMMALGSLKDAREAAEMSIALPSVWHFDNYAQVFARANILRAMRNSIVITFTSVALTVFASSTAAFYFGRVSGRRARMLSNIFYLGLIAPPAIVTSIKLLQTLGISGTFLGVILVFSAMNIPFSVFLIAGLVKTIPRELDEAAIIDGCSPGGLFFRVVFPLLAPVIATASIVVFMAVWNSFMIPLYFLNQSTKWTMPLTVYGFFGQFLSDWHLVFADLLLTAAPVIVVYAFAQRYIIEGMATGAVKG